MPESVQHNFTEFAKLIYGTFLANGPEMRAHTKQTDYADGNESISRANRPATVELGKLRPIP